MATTPGAMKRYEQKLCIRRFALSAAVLILCWLPLSAQAVKSSRGFADVGDGRLYYEVAGKGPAVVLIHGGLVDSRLWDDQFYEFARKFRVVRYDLRGYGRSDFPTKPFSHVDDLISLLKFLMIKKASFVGLSVGGNVALDLTISHPEMVEKLVLSGSGLRGNGLPPNKENAAVYKAAEEKGMETAIAMWLENPIFATAKNNPDFVKRTRVMLADNYKYWGPTPEPIPEVWSKPPTADRLTEIKKPTLVIVGEKDARTLLQIADILTKKIAGSKKIVFPNVSHHLNMEIPREFNKAVIEFLRK
jgi:pimeloyl-ACP methyl ester carboxylesterase